MQLTDNKFIFPRHNLLSDYTNCPEQLIRFILKTSSPLSKIILIFPESEKYFLCYSTFIYLFFFCNHSNCPMSSINHPKYKAGGRYVLGYLSLTFLTMLTDSITRPHTVTATEKPNKTVGISDDWRTVSDIVSVVSPVRISIIL